MKNRTIKAMSEPKLTEEKRGRQKSNASSLKSTLSGIFNFKNVPIEFSSSLDDYEILKEVGGIDGISFLYLAKHLPSDRLISLKLTDLNLSADIQYLDEILSAIRNTNLCHDKHILPYYHNFLHKEALWVVAPPLPFGTCKQVIKLAYPIGFDEAMACTILKDVIKALVYLHGQGYIHNDIRADNLVISEKGHIQLTGMRPMMSKRVDGKLVRSVFSLVGDNIEWAAPEVVCQNTKYDEKADIYSLGITALELVFGRTPFDGWAPLMILLSKMEYPCPGIPGMRDKPVSEAFWRFVLKCLDKDPALRPSAETLLADPLFKNAVNKGYIKNQLQKINRMGLLQVDDS